MKTEWYIVVLALVCTCGVRATDLPVSTPAEFGAAVAAARAGDSITMVNGTWTDARLVFAGTGTATQPITLRAETRGAVTIVGASNLRIAGQYLIVDGLVFRDGYSPSGAIVEFRNSSTGSESHNCRLTNTVIVSFNPASSTTDYKWVSLYGSFNRVDHCYFRGKNHAGTTLVVWLSASPNHHRIDRNHFASRPPLGVNGGETIRVGTSDWSMYDSYTVVEENLFEECNGETEIISNKSCENIYRANTFRRCDGTLTLRHGNRCTVDGNFFFGEGVSNTGGIRIIGEDHRVINNYLTGLMGTGYRAAIAVMNGVVNSPLNRYFQVKRAVIAFNTLVGNAASFDFGVGKSTELSLPPIDCLVANTLVQGTSGPFIRFTDTPVNLQWEGNVFYGASLGIAQTAGILGIDPLLQSAGPDGLRRPGTGSPLIDASVGTFTFVPMDMDGQQRSGLKDIGADEASSDVVLSRPLLPADVGPEGTPAGTGDPSSTELSSAYRFPAAYPNPFNPQTTLSFSVPAKGHASLVVYNVLAELVAAPFDGWVDADTVQTVVFDASHLPGGVYFAVLTHGQYRAVQQVLLLH